MKRSHTSYLTALEQKEASTHKRQNRWHEIIQLLVEIDKMKTKRTIQRCKGTNSVFFNKIKDIDKPYPNELKDEERISKLTKSKMKGVR